MTFLRSWLINSLIIFVINNVIPGVHVSLFEAVPDVFADLVFSGAVGLLNALVFPVLDNLVAQVRLWQIVLVTGGISFAAYLLVWVTPLGINVVSFGGWLLAGLLVWAGAVVTNYLEQQISAS